VAFNSTLRASFRQLEAAMAAGVDDAKLAE